MFSLNLIDNWWKTKEQTPRKEKHGWSSEPSEEPSGRGRSGEQSSRWTKIKDSSKNSMMVLREGVRRLSRHEESDWKHPSGEHIGFCTQNPKDFYTTVPSQFECHFLFFCPSPHYITGLVTDTLFGNKPWASEMSTKVFAAFMCSTLWTLCQCRRPCAFLRHWHKWTFKSALRKSRPDWNSRKTCYTKVYAPDWSVL